MNNSEGKAQPKEISIRKITKDWVLPLALAFVMATTIRSYALARVDVDGPSMNATLQNKDVMFEEKISLFTNSIKRGDIVTFYSHDKERPSYIKRVIGLAGDTIELKEGKIYLNGTELNEPYLTKDTVTEGGTFLDDNVKYTVPKDSYFVFGDNREVSEDSRYFGPVKAKDIQGRVFVRIFPFKSMRTF